MIIALASPCVASTLDEGLDKIKLLMSEASAQGAQIVCFPEAYIPGPRGQDFEVLPFDRTQQERGLQAVAQWARTIGAGNAGQGVAYAARQAGVPCTVVVIETAPESKIERMRALGASLIPVP